MSLTPAPPPPLPLYYVHFGTAGQRFHLVHPESPRSECGISMKRYHTIVPLTDSLGRPVVWTEYLCQTCAGRAQASR
jgi:hypothetical protein